MLKNYFTLNHIDQNKKYLIGFSGGPDSTFLFFHMLNLLGNKNIVVAHVNYNLRLESADAEGIVKKYCEENVVPFFLKSVNPTKKGNIESWARKERYDFFYDIAKKENCDAVAIAHNFNDDIETYALQKQRSNIVTYFGLKPISHWKDLVVVRPILHIKKTDVLKWIEENNLIVDFDKTNDDTKYKRNEIRKNITEQEVQQYQKEMVSKNRMMGWVYKKIEPILKSEFKMSDFLPLNDKEELVFIYEYLKRFIPDFDVSKMKKNITSEIVKQLRSGKSYLCIAVNDKYAIIKDRDEVFSKKLDLLNLTYEIKSENDFPLLKKFKNQKELIDTFNRYGKLIVTNNFFDYQSKLYFRGKPVNKFFLKYKISYRYRIENAVAFKKSDYNILTKIR